MPGRFLSDAERERLTRFPTEVPPEDLVSAFTLSPKDITRVLLRRGQPNYLGLGERYVSCHQGQSSGQYGHRLYTLFLWLFWMCR